MVPKAGNICDTIFPNTNTRRLIWLPALLILLLHSTDISSIRRLVRRAELLASPPDAAGEAQSRCLWRAVTRSHPTLGRAPEDMFQAK